ncbi:hypothetical protein B0H14DRAFT_2382012, partial [Mycena olivaceomarginata]
WAPHLFQFYINYMGAFYCKNPNLQQPFINSTCLVCTFDLGPRTCPFGHRDFANLGRWVITTLGMFNYTKGGKLTQAVCYG